MWQFSNWRCCSYHTASKSTYRLYIYVTQLDLLFKSPSWNYNSTTGSKLCDSVKGLLVLFSVLNGDVKQYYKDGYETFPKTYSGFEKCGWADAMSESKGIYKREVLIEKPGKSLKHSPSPTPPMETSDDDTTRNFHAFSAECDRRMGMMSLQQVAMMSKQ